MKNLIVFSLLLGVIFFSGCVANEPKACTEEAKLCPDGSAVGRTGPDCEFSPCPSSNGTLEMIYQPMQCQETPWQAWYKEGHIQYIMAPTEEQLVIAYLSWNNITVSSAKRIETGNIVCQACEVCPTTYHYAIISEQQYLLKLLQFGFSKID